jgi:dUTP pyrophosphatase
LTENIESQDFKFNGTTKTVKTKTDADGNVIQNDEQIEAHWLESGKTLDQLKQEAEDLIKKSKESFLTYNAIEYGSQCKISKSVEIGLHITGDDESLTPRYQTDGASGMDVYANINEPITLKSLERRLIPTGLFVELPEGYEFQLRPRSGLALKRGLTLLNCLGTIDDDYRKEIGAIVVNLSNEDAIIEPKERIGQLVLSKVDKAHWKRKHLDEFSDTNRKDGYGSTGFL